VYYLLWNASVGVVGFPGCGSAHVSTQHHSGTIGVVFVRCGDCRSTVNGETELGNRQVRHDDRNTVRNRQ